MRRFRFFYKVSFEYMPTPFFVINQVASTVVGMIDSHGLYASMLFYIKQEIYLSPFKVFMWINRSSLIIEITFSIK